MKFEIPDDQPDLKALRGELQKLYSDFQSELPSGNSPQDIKKLRTLASHAASSMLVMALYRRSLEEFIRRKESAVILAHNQAGDLPTPKEKSLDAFINQELATEKSYYHELETLIDVAKTRVILITSLLKSVGDERYLP